MSDTQQQTGPVKLINDRRDNENEFESWEDAQEAKDDMVALGASPDDFRIEQIDENGHSESESKTETTDGGEPQETEVIDSHEQVGPRDLPDVNDRMQDPLGTLPEWMKTEIEHGDDVAVDLNKRGSQVIANALELVVSAECEIAATDTDFDYCRYRATAETPGGEVYTAVGDAHIDESNTSAWDLERLAETRAKKRAVKWATGGGIQAFLETNETD